MDTHSSTTLVVRLNKIVTGGQSGVDQGALYAARNNHIVTGGYAPNSFQTETGPNFSLQDFGLIAPLVYTSYAGRTELNVRHSDGTLIIAKNFDSRGTKLTEYWASRVEKPHIGVLAFSDPTDHLKRVRLWMEENRIEVLNIAGNRESVAPGIFDWTYTFVERLIGLNHLVKEENHHDTINAT